MENSPSKPRRFGPSSLLDYWTAGSFIGAVVLLFMLRGLELSVLVFFLGPPAIVYFWQQFSPRTSTRILSAFFLTSIDIGVSLGKFDRLFPELGGVSNALSPAHDRILAWYCAMYIAYIFFVLPIMLFGRGLLDTYKGRTPQFSSFTCALGLLACLAVGPFLIGIVWSSVGLFPVWKP